MTRSVYLILLQLIFCSSILSQNNSVLSSGKWYKISTTQNGIYKLDYSDFQNLGINSEIQFSNIKLYGNGGGMLPKLNSEYRHSDLTQNAIKIIDLNENGLFEATDYILFYGMSSGVWNFNEATNLFNFQNHLFADEVNYFICLTGQNLSKRITKKPSLQNPQKIITSYNYFLRFEEELVNLISSGSKWFGEKFSNGSKKNFTFSMPNLILSEEIDVEIAVAARSFQQSNFQIDINSNLLSNFNVPAVSPQYAQEYAKEVYNVTKYLANSNNLNLEIKYFSDDIGAESWLNYIEVNSRNKLEAQSNFFTFRDINSLGNEIGNFVIKNGADFQVWDITEPSNVRELPTTINNNDLSFNDSLNILREYIAFNNSSFLSPVLQGEISNQNIRNISSSVEFIIVTHPNFFSAANRLANLHLDLDNLNTKVVTTTQVYNEFSSGMQDVTAIRDFVKFQYDKENSNLKYLLLFGDGSFDPKNRIQNNTNYIPTYQSLNSTHPTLSYVSDDFFGLLDDNEGLFINDLVDIGIGRLPVSTINESNLVVDKIEKYYSFSSFGSWRNNITFIADDGDASDGNTHMWQADSLANHVADNYGEINIQKIYLDNYEQESTPGGPRSEKTQNAINNSIDKGVFLVNYTGHGSPLGWSQERILEIEQIESWKNIDNLPLFMTATCKFSYFDNPFEKSAGELLLLNPDGGAIALLSTTRLVYSAPNYNLNTKFIRTLFNTSNNEFLRLGDVFKSTKILSGTSSNNRNFTLLGNPALRLAHPQFDVFTTQISDTLKAMGKVQINGQVESLGNLMTDFNGVINVTVYDKEIIKNTLGQESCTPMPYRDQNNIIYKGAASVNNGLFSFSFVVPKDISYNYGKGKISYYAVNHDELLAADANGMENNFIIGGTADEIIYDYDPAEISLFINDTLFKDGGITDQNPVLLANIFDYSGINTVGNGIGHDITATLDGNTASPYILNDFYQANQDDYTKGSIRFPLYNLSNGEHQLTLKVWDVFNNSSESTIKFFVNEGSNLIIDNLLASPNPFSNSTDIYFDHNQTNQEIDYVLEIFSVSGHLVKRISKQFNTIGNRIGPIRWNGLDNNGYKIRPGLYIARLRVSNENDDFTSKSTRIILLPK